jgi:hypothetical protein
MRAVLYPAPRCLVRDPEVTVARIALGLTVYVADPWAWARGGAATRLARFLEGDIGRRLRWYTTSAMTAWEPLTERSARRVLEALALPWDRAGLRHGFQLRVASSHDAPEAGFTYRELDDAHGGAGWARWVLPADADPDELLHLAIEVGHALPFCAGVGGYVWSLHEGDRPTSYEATLPLARRYVGVEVCDPDAQALALGDGIAGVNWLTLLGGAAGEAAGAALRSPWREAVAVMALRHGTLVRAGAAPTLGDVHAMACAHAYAEVAARLAPWREAVAAVPRWSEEEVAAWQRRFVEPEAWARG